MLKSTVACIAWLLMVAPAAAEPTQIVVRVISQDGKFVGDHTGGASITLREVKSGRVLARGVTRGGTGDTERIMEASRRSPSIALADAASYKVTLDLGEPTLVDLEVEGPIGRPRRGPRATRDWRPSGCREPRRCAWETKARSASVD